MHHPTDRITHTTVFVTPVVEHWLEQEILCWGFSYYLLLFVFCFFRFFSFCMILFYLIFLSNYFFSVIFLIINFYFYLFIYCVFVCLVTSPEFRSLFATESSAAVHATASSTLHSVHAKIWTAVLSTQRHFNSLSSLYLYF